MPATEQTWRSLTLMHKLFAISGLVLLGGTILMFAKDNDREWKDYQRSMRKIDVSNTRWEEIKAEALRNRNLYEDLQRDLAIAQATRPEELLLNRFVQSVRLDAEARKVPESEWKSVESRINTLAKAVPEFPPQFPSSKDEAAFLKSGKKKRQALLDELSNVIAAARFREEKLSDDRKLQSSQYDAVRSDLDLGVRDGKPAAEMEKINARVVAVKEKLESLTAQYQKAAAHRQELQKILGEINAHEAELAKKIADNMAEVHRIVTGLDERQALWFEGFWPGKKWLEMPILDAFNSPLKIDNLWTDGLTHDMYNFKSVLRYDRCTTCHKSIEKTAPGSATDPAYEPIHTLTFSLPTPSREDFNKAQEDLAKRRKELEEKGRAAEAQNLSIIDDIYGFRMAAEGLLKREDVTLNYVRAESRAASAGLAEDAEGLRYLSREVLESSLDPTLDDRKTPVFGLQTGDVIEEINGNQVASPNEVRRMLLETVTWGQSVNLKVRRGYPQPFVTHPRLDLFVGSTSPHKLQTMGCTVCHDGQGSSTSFKWASHYPNTIKQRDQWRKEHGWFDNHHWIYPMYPERFSEAACLKCHHEVVELEPSERFPEPPAPTLMSGYDAVRTYGCFGCHEIVGFDGPAKRIGPDMRLEPNYFAAGLQVAYLSNLREGVLTQRQQELSQGGDGAKPELDAITANLSTLTMAKQLGDTIGSETWNETARRRLKQIVDEDAQRLADYETAKAAGEKVEPFYPAFTPETYKTAAVLKDEEMPGQYRKVGPALRYIATKVDQAWLDDWIREPKHFRPSTRMPQFFGQFDHLTGEDDKQTKAMRDHTAGLELIEIQGIRSYLLKYSQPFSPLGSTDSMAAAAVAEGDAERGKLLFETGGCLACHSNKDFPGHGIQGPDLTGAGSKFLGEKGRDWLYGWIENPKRYHARTKMPVVPLKARPGDKDTDPIADVVAYLMSSKAEGWQPFDEQGTVDAKVLDALSLEHLAKAFYESDARDYLRTGIPESRRKELKGAEVELLVPEHAYESGATLTQEQKLLYIGNKTIGKYGCYACHDIPGFEDSKPIGTALSDWGRKDPSRLAFEHIDHYMEHGHGHAAPAADHAHDVAAVTHGGDHPPGEESAAVEAEAAAHAALATQTAGEVNPDDEAFFAAELHHHSRVGFINQKLVEPRSFDFKKTEFKPYNDRLRMPQFPLSEEQRGQVITFVLGLVADPPAQQFVYSPSPRAQAINDGRRVLEQFNCAGCHQLSEEKWDISFPAGWDRLGDPPTPNAFPFLIPHVSRAERDASKEVSRSGRQTATLIGRAKRRPEGQIDTFAFSKDEDDYLSLNELEGDEFQVDQLAYRFEVYSPALLDGRQFMPKDPLPVLPLDTIKRRIAREGGDLAHYLLPRALAIANSANQQKGEEAWGWLPPTLVGEGNKVQPDWLHSFLLEPHPIRPAAILNMPKFNMSPNEATKLVNYFGAKDNAVYPYEYEQRTSQSHLDAAAKLYQESVNARPAGAEGMFSGDRFDDAMRIVTSTAGCVKCHALGDFDWRTDPTADPLGKGPDLTYVHRRLRPGYARRWIAKPSYILPYTAMPDNFTYAPGKENDGFAVRNLYHGDSIEQLDAVVDVIMNFDKYAQRSTKVADLVPKTPPVEGETPPAEGEAPAEGERPVDAATPAEAP